MIDVDIDARQGLVDELQTTLKDGLVATDIWDRQTALSLVGVNQQPAACALFTTLTNELADTLSGSGFPGLSNYYLLKLEGDHLVVILRYGQELLHGIILKADKVTWGSCSASPSPRPSARATRRYPSRPEPGSTHPRSILVVPQRGDGGARCPP